MLDNFFNYKEKGTNFKTKIMAYILGINPSIALKQKLWQELRHFSLWTLGVNPSMLAEG